MKSKAARISFPVISNLNSVTPEELAGFMRYGFCYVKLPGTAIQSDIKRIRTKAKSFFLQSSEYKERFPLDGPAYKGYYSRQKTEDPQLAEQVIFWPNDPIEPFKESQQEITSIFNSFAGDIGLPLLSKVFQQANLLTAFKDLTHKTTDTFSFLYYPDAKALKGNFKSGVNAHQDWGLITMLHIDRPGLVVKVGEQWHPVDPMPDHIVVNNGLVTMLASNNQVEASHHEVLKINGDRLSLAVFLAPNMQTPIQNYVTGEKITSSYLEFTQKMFSGSYRIGGTETTAKTSAKTDVKPEYGRLFNHTQHEAPDKLLLDQTLSDETDLESSPSKRLS